MIRISTSESGVFFLFFFFNDTATTEIYTLSLHDALPISLLLLSPSLLLSPLLLPLLLLLLRWHNSARAEQDRSEEHTSELQSRPHISYAVFCLKKKNITI